MSKLLEEIRSLAVVALHPDDETLGCGGLIAIRREKAIPVTLIFVSDGTGSHPRSQAFPPERLRQLRAREAQCAAQILGVPERAIAFFGLRDTAVPRHSRDDEFLAVADRIVSMLKDAETDTVAVTHRREPHSDHRACYHLARKAVERLACEIRILEYRVWLPASAAISRNCVLHSLEISPVLDRKRAAVACYRSQTTDLIDDDPNGFRLSSADISRLSGPQEYFEEQDR
jgi:LmbE family N-acetylglucosaminyl deacetylase